MKILFLSLFFLAYNFLWSQLDSLDWVTKNNSYQLKEVFENQSPKDYFKLLDSLKTHSKSFPITLDKDTLFRIWVSMAHLSIKDRKHQMEENIKFLANLNNFDTKLFQITEIGSDWNLFYDKKFILTVNEWDALWENQKPEILLQLWKKRIEGGILKYKNEMGTSHLLLRILKLSFVILFFVLLLWLIHFLSNYLQYHLINKRLQFSKNVKVSNTALVGRIGIRVLRYLANVLQYLLSIITIFFIIPMVFSFFPNSKPFADQIIDYIEKPFYQIIYGFINFLPNLFTIVVVIVVTRFFLRMVRFLAEAIEDEDILIKGFYPEWAIPTYNLFKILTYIFTLIAIFPYLPGSNSPFFQGISVFVGLLISFGSSSAISNLIAGIILTYMRPFKIGDLIKIGDISGYVQEKSLWSVKIKTIKNEIIGISNVNVLNQNILNYSLSDNYIVRSTVSIGYDIPWQKVHELLIIAAENTQSVQKEPKPFVLQLSLSDFYIVYEINAYTNNSLPYFDVQSLLNENIQKTFHAANVQIMSPHHFTLHSSENEKRL